MEITKEQFEKYENIRVSGITNMWNIDLIRKYTDLTETQIFYIMKHFSSLKEKLGVKNE